MRRVNNKKAVSAMAKEILVARIVSPGLSPHRVSVPIPTNAATVSALNVADTTYSR